MKANLQKTIRYAAIAILVIGGIAVVTYFGKTNKNDSSLTESPSNATNAPKKSSEPVPVTVLPIASEFGTELQKQESDPQEDLAVLQSMLYHYRQTFGSNPEGGENVVIAEKLLGRNGKRIGFIEQDAKFLNSDGALIDRWGTPYFFHPVSGEEMEIVSAGPDAELWTEDDLKL